ncbi:MAG: hypothetical protein HYT73_01395 [Candidatus Aenigmarchaeota archaeon]|nr:hypothetical protein [Candidatus Aenigmarchaeota archaeon]
MLGDTHRLLRRLKKHHYLVRRETDSNDGVCWNIYQPQGAHTAPDMWDRNDAYVGTVQSFNPGPVQIRDAYLCFGRPTLFFNETHEKTDVKKELQQIVSYFPRAKFIQKRL